MKLSYICLLSIASQLALAIATPNLQAAENPETFNNPILPGFHPDPSICRVGDTYYMVNSSFEWFPGVPIHHSKDLINWELIGHALEHPSQLAMKEGMRPSRGIWAPTIRHHDGLFYMITTAQDSGGNFFVTAKDPAGDWSEPVWIEGAPGIDPSLFWDDDGRCWFTAASTLGQGQLWPNMNGVYIAEIDPSNGKLLSKKTYLTAGHAANARWTEGPHIFKRNSKYVLLVAEGGTGFHHAVTLHHADDILGPYTPDHANPTLTHRHLGLDAQITTIGHGDIVETQKGEWWMVTLGVRPLERNNLLGRETFLLPVEWQGQTLVANPSFGIVKEVERRPELPWTPTPKTQPRDEFTETTLSPVWNFLRTPFETWYELDTANGGRLILDLRPESVRDLANPSLIARRIQDFNYRATTRVTFDPLRGNETAGLVAVQNDKFHYRLLLMEDAGSVKAQLVRCENGEDTIVASKPWNSSTAIFQMRGTGLNLQFYIGESEKQLQPFGDPQDAAVIGTAKAGGFTGPYVGMYASSEGLESENIATFEWFEYRNQ